MRTQILFHRRPEESQMWYCRPWFDNRCMHWGIPHNLRSQRDSSRMDVLLSHLPCCLHFAWTEIESLPGQKVNVCLDRKWKWKFLQTNQGFTCSRMHDSAPKGQSLLVPQIGQSHQFHFLPVRITSTEKPTECKLCTNHQLLLDHVHWEKFPLQSKCKYLNYWIQILPELWAPHSCWRQLPHSAWCS